MLSHSVFLIFRHIQTWRDPHAGHRSVLQHGVGDLSFFKVRETSVVRKKEPKSEECPGFSNGEGEELFPHKEMLMTSWKDSWLSFFE